MSTGAGDRPESELGAALLEAAARLIAAHGSARLTLRRVADEVGTSTMAVYTNFGGMPGLRRAVRREGLARLSTRVAAVPRTEDPVADLARVCLAYYENAAENPDLYRAVFMEEPFSEADAITGSDAFQLLVAAVERCIDAGAFTSADPTDLATQLWALGHGGVTLQLAQLLSPDQTSRCLIGALGHLLAAYATGAGAQRSLQTAFEGGPE